MEKLVGAAPCQWQEHSFEISFGLLPQLLAQDGSPAVAVTTPWVKEAQKADAVAAWDLMKLAHEFVSGFVQPKATAAKARREEICILMKEGW